ncbi:PREDICTED: uncharacterized protein LOC105449947 [Wasmannia auropunctata]|uniref:uncharacterized protein LOC105449947 n=1 Tax=Wasmannia auropunctata TaxID=64793 RepID=UPI0005EE279B|nr:PREDICTED: uncharacterized protein LOC105449947 [Wasmannia auropunctata]
MCFRKNKLQILKVSLITSLLYFIVIRVISPRREVEGSKLSPGGTPKRLHSTVALLIFYRYHRCVNYQSWVFCHCIQFEGSQININIMSMTSKKIKSDVWKYFTKENSISARCILCTKIIKHGGNTTNLHNHYKNVHKVHVGSKPTEPCWPKRLKTKAAVDTINEEKLNTHNQRQTMSIIDISTDSNIDDPIPTSEQDFSSENSISTVDSLQGVQDSKFKTKQKVKSRDFNRLTKITESFTRINSFMDGGSSANKLTNCIHFMIASECKTYHYLSWKVKHSNV